MVKILDLRKKKKEELIIEIIPAPQILEPQVKEFVKSSLTWWTSPREISRQATRNRLFFIVGLIGIGLYLMYSAQNILLGITLVIAAVTVFLSTRLPDQSKKIRIDQAGVAINEIKYYFTELDSFWITYYPEGLKELSLKSKKFYAPYLKASLGNTNPLDIRTLMISYLPEKKHEQSFLDILSEKLGL